MMTRSGSFKAVLREARIRLGLTQEEAARRLGVSVSTLSRWERGEHLPRSRPILERIREVLGVDLKGGAG